MVTSSLVSLLPAPLPIATAKRPFLAIPDKQHSPPVTFPPCELSFYMALVFIYDLFSVSPFVWKGFCLFFFSLLYPQHLAQYLVCNRHIIVIKCHWMNWITHFLKNLMTAETCSDQYLGRPRFADNFWESPDFLYPCKLRASLCFRVPVSKGRKYNLWILESWMSISN